MSRNATVQEANNREAKKLGGGNCGWRLREHSTTQSIGADNHGNAPEVSLEARR